MLKQSISIALAIVGLIVGAGFASGQEVLQYFIAFGAEGIWAALITAIIMSIAVFTIVQLGSYFGADEHTAVFDSVAHPIISKIFDFIVVFALFCIGFVMFAGAGANLNQQWDLPNWVGSTIMLGLVLVCGLLNVDKVSRVIGAITPFVIVAVIFAAVISFMQIEQPFAYYEQIAQTVRPALPNPWIAVINYVGLALVLAVSMMIVIGGNQLNPRIAGIGGLAGGCLFGFLLLTSTLALFFEVENIKDSDMPMLTLINNVNPILGVIMALIIYGMIFNTAIGLFYALGKRLSTNKPQRFYPYFVITCLAGFAFSFLGFRTLVSYVYPVLGYAGAFLIICLMVAWFKDRAVIKKEIWRRNRIRELVNLKLHPEEEFTKKDAAELDFRVNNSNLDNDELAEQVHQEVAQELVNDDSVDFDKKDAKKALKEYQNS